MNNTVLAKRKRLIYYFDLAMKKIWISIEHDYRVGNYALVHFLDHSELFGEQYIACENQTDLNNIKSKLLNNGFKIDWTEFNKALEWINDH